MAHHVPHPARGVPVVLWVGLAAERDPMKKPDNKQARLMGVLDHGTFPTVAAATRAALEFGVSAHREGHALSTLAVLMNKSDPTNVNVTLGRRHYWRSAPSGVMPADVLARLNAPDPADSLLLLVAHDDCDSHTVLTLKVMQEALAQ